MDTKALEILRLETLRQVEKLAFQALHSAATPAALAAVGTAIAPYLAECLHARFQRAMRERYGLLTRPGTADGEPIV